MLSRHLGVRDMALFRWLAVLPFIGMLAGPIFHDHVHPFILGMPFILGWIVVWILITSLILAVIYLTDPANREDRR